MHKFCYICGANINLQSSFAKLCSSCYRLYGKNNKESWVIELQKQQETQEIIDRRECKSLSYNMYTDIYGNYMGTKLDSLVQFPTKNHKLVEQVLALYDKSLEDEELGLGKRLTLRALAKLVGNKVTFKTIGNILARHKRSKNKRGKSK